ncbi:MAG: hypothetical protein L6R41_008459, partial [Letrouitia leprolyta]
MRRTQLVSLLAICFLVLITTSLLRRPSYTPIVDSSNPPESPPIPPSDDTSHPIHQLITEAERDFDSTRSRQSQTLADAVTEYRRRYKVPPPPNFDKWYQFAKERNVRFIDEYDEIYHALLPFWALEPRLIRGRAREALGFDNGLLGVLIRDGAVATAAGGPEWQQKSTVGMMDSFVKHLPDMDLPFNLHDEPRVVIPDDDLSRLVAAAKDQSMPVSFTNPSLRNSWSPKPADLDDGKRFSDVKTTRFNWFAHQATWTNSRMSCPPESPVRALDEVIRDDSKSFTFSNLGLISNHTAFSDICLSPSLQERFGFFGRPNAFKIVHDLFPIFSQSKISSYQDILYPSPWYWAEKVAPDMNSFKLQDVQRQDYKHMFDVKFSHIGQCDPDDCNAQKEYFEVVKPSKQQDAWAYKYLLDMDGNAFSGRFYAFLKSRSMIYKMAIFREWHEAWLRPWIHYVPLSLKGDEYLESVRYFNEEEVGKSQARRIAAQSREWAGQVLRNEDFEAWFFRLLLEHGHSAGDIERAPPARVEGGDRVRHRPDGKARARQEAEIVLQLAVHPLDHVGGDAEQLVARPRIVSGIGAQVPDEGGQAALEAGGRPRPLHVRGDARDLRQAERVELLRGHVGGGVFADLRLVIGLAVGQRLARDGGARPGQVFVEVEGAQLAVGRADRRLDHPRALRPQRRLVRRGHGGGQVVERREEGVPGRVLDQ